jgi:hypothetical protein
MSDEKAREVAVALSQNLISSIRALRFGADAKNYFSIIKKNMFILFTLSLGLKCLPVLVI